MEVNRQNFTVCMGCVFSQRDVHIYCENGHPDAYIHVSIGTGCPFLCENMHPGCVFLGMPIIIHLTPVNEGQRSCTLLAEGVHELEYSEATYKLLSRLQQALCELIDDFSPVGA